MKKKCLTLFLFLYSCVLFAQNGGIQSENNCLKLEFIGFSGNDVVVKTTNKRSCESTVRIQWGSLNREKMIGSLLSDTFHLQSQSQRFIRAQSTASCGPNCGTVEIDYLNILPVKFEYINVRLIAKRIVNVQFKISESDGTERFNIQVSKDGKNFKTVEVVLPDKINPNKIYSVNLKI